MDLYKFDKVLGTVDQRQWFGKAIKHFVLAVVATAFAAFLFSCGDQNSQIVQNENTGGALGTSYSIIYQSDRELDFQDEIDSVFRAVNQSLSTYIGDSDISKINQGDTTIVVDDMFREVFELSKEVHHKTDGYFDPTVGVLVNAWGFGPERKMTMDSTRVDSLLAYVGFDKVSLSENGRVKKENPTIYFDFNAIAKGYAIDRLARMMDGMGIQNYLLEVGGELVAKGENRMKKQPWVVGIDDPQVEVGRRLKLMLHLKNRALASSGNYRKFRVDSISGEKYVHTVDPKTGYTKNANTLAATVLATNCAEADAYATAFMAMNLEDALAFLMKHKGLDAYIIYLENGETKEFMTDGFKELVVVN
ncbi:FAD:protein FMN transferase [Flavobacteriaceae bacterium TP-CH-4]|uniref:FAD:protein FMN transferase n=2 Tax=Pelagihabitans pacificus TaxID=2696054 RepID=A0A967AVQ2_9FLAO|nr:FAD:protein FMN transferase [Pelagihabitans pacificus]